MNFALVNVASACYSPLHFGFRWVWFTSAFSFILKMLVLIVATEINPFLNENHVRGCTQRHMANILNTDLLVQRLLSWLRHTAVKMARLTNFDRKGVQIVFTNKPLTLQM